MSQRELERMTRRYTAEVHAPHRAGSRHSRAGPRDERADHGVDHGHLRHDPRPDCPGSRGRASRSSSEARRAVGRRRAEASSTSSARRRGKRGSTSRTPASPSRATERRPPSWHTSCGGRARRSSPWPMPRGGGQYPGVDIGALWNHAREATRWPGSRAESPLEAMTCWNSRATCSYRPPSGADHVEERRRIRARIVAEGANGPTTPEADAILAEQGCSSSPTSSPTLAAWSSPTSNGFRASSTTSGGKARSTHGSRS